MKKFSLFLALILCANLSIWGETKTIIVDGITFSSTATAKVEERVYGDVTFAFSPGAKKQTSTSATNSFSNEGCILIGKEGAYVYNVDPIPGKITKFEIYANAGASAKVSVGVYFSATAIESYRDTINTYTETLSTLNSVYDCSAKLPQGAKYFWYQVTNAYNSQVQFRITYEMSAADVIPVTGITLNTNAITLSEGANETLIATIAPETATNKSINWASTNESVATVVDGVVTAVSAGTATITATSAADDTKSASCTVTVEAVDYSGNYVIYAKRSTGNYWMMTNDLGTAKTERFTAEATELTTLPSSITTLKSNIWQIEKVNGGYTIKSLDNNQYIDWTSENSSTLSNEGKVLTITPSTEGSCIISFVNNTETRTLSLNKDSGNDYFAFYSTTSQCINLYLVEAEAAIERTITWNVNGVITTQNFADGQMLEFPENPTAMGYSFMGWYASEVTATDVAPTFVTPVAVTADATYYAVFAKCHVGNAEEYSFEITPDDFNSKSYDANNNEKSTTAKATNDNTKTINVKWTSNQVMLQSSVMQWQSGKGYIYNSTDLGSIKSVVVNSSAGTFTTYYGKSENPSSGSNTGNEGFFKVKVGSATGKTTNVVVTFEISEGSTYFGYTTSPILPEIQLHNEEGGDAGWINLGTYKYGTDETIEGDRTYTLSVNNYVGEYTFGLIDMQEISTEWGADIFIDNSTDAETLNVIYEINIPKAAANLNTTFHVVACSGTKYDETKIIAEKDIQVYIDINATGAFVSTSLDNATISDNVRKVMRDGKIFIIRDGITYSVDGRVVE